MRFILTLWISKLIALAVSLIDKQRGSNYSGKIAIKLMPDFVAKFRNINYDKVFFISGTNGKSTTTNLLYHTLKTAEKSVAANLEGANMMGGVATTLIKHSGLTGKFNKEYLVLEIDERSFPAIRKVLPGRNLGITNLQKDQVQRNGDPDFILRKFQAAVNQEMTLYLNNEEPRSRSLEDQAGKAKYFSVAENDKTYKSDDFYTVTLPCPKCAHPIAYQNYNLANIGQFHCTKCAYQSVDNPHTLISSVDFAGKTFTCDQYPFTVPYSNPFYIYNFAMCLTICKDIGLSMEQIAAGFASFQNPASHEDILYYRGKEIHYLRGKQENPEALQSELDIIASDKRRKAVFVGLYRVADFDPHYSGSFYFFDCDFKSIVNSGVEHYVAFSKTEANDIASRMILAGANEQDVTIYDTDDIGTVFQKLDEIQTEVIYILTNPKHAKVIKNYLSNGGASHA